MIYPTIILTTVEKATGLPLPVFASKRQEVVWSERSKSCRHLLSHVLAEAGPPQRCAKCVLQAGTETGIYQSQLEEVWERVCSRICGGI